jgi:fluoride exporter
MALIVWVSAGGAIGAALRFALAGAVGATAFPWAILIVNVTGSFAMGLIAEYGAAKGAVGPELRAFLTAGVLGGFTTFSAFSLDTATLIERGALLQAFAYAAGSVVLSIGALFAGLAMVRALP